MLFFRNIFLFLVISFGSLNTSKASCSAKFPSTVYTLGLFAANILPYPDCQCGIFFALNDGSAQENTFCAFNTLGIIAAATLTANIASCTAYTTALAKLQANPVTAGSATTVAEGIETSTFYVTYTAAITTALQTLRGTADLHAKRVTVCKVDKDDVWPAAYPDSHIKELLIKSGEEPTVANIIDKYDKICLYDSLKGSRKWLKFEECWIVDGVYHCAYGPENIDSSIMLCTRAGSTCPCAINSDYGTLGKPNYQKDSKGVIKTDTSAQNGVSKNTLKIENDGTYLKRSAEYYTKHAGAHCRVLRNISRAPITPSYSGIVDDVCDTWAGYSKNRVTLTAGIVQCITSTMRNLFEKPMPGTNIGVTLTDKQNIQYNQYTNDIKVVNDAMLNIENINNNSQVSSYSVAPDLLSLNAKIIGINNKSLFGELTGPTYGSSVATVNDKYKDYANNISNIDNLLLQNKDYQDKIDKLKKDNLALSNQNGALYGIIQDDKDKVAELKTLQFGQQSDVDNIQKKIDGLNSDIDTNNIELKKCSSYINGRGDLAGCGTCGAEVPAGQCIINSSTYSCSWRMLNCNQCGDSDCGGSCDEYCYANDYQNLLLPEWKVARDKGVTLNDSLDVEKNNLKIATDKLTNTNNLLSIAEQKLKSDEEKLESNSKIIDDNDNEIDRLQKLIEANYITINNSKNSSQQLTVDFYDNLNAVNHDLTSLLNEIINEQNQFMANALAANSAVGYTPFQSLQGAMMGFTLLVFVFFMVYIGYRMITGELSANINDFLPILLDIALVYYFAIGGAWKDLLINFVVNTANGLGQLALEIPLNVAGNSDKCQYYQNYYIPDPSETKCSFVNPSGSIDLQIVTYEPKTGKAVNGCIKGPYLPAPQYEKIYKPVLYGVLNKYGAIEKTWLPVYCKNDNDSTKFVLADIAVNQITGDYTMLSCKKGYTMEDGYRVSELKKMGISHNNLSTDSSGVVHTAIEIAGENGTIINVIESIQNDTLKVTTANNKYKNKVFMESIRSSVNKFERHYPVVNQYGVYRDMSYVAMFDTLDCKIMHYFGYTPEDKEDVIYVKFVLGLLLAFPFGWVVGILLLAFAIMLFSMLGKLTQSYIVSMSTLMILLFMSPMIFPLKLFPQTKGYFDEWIKKVTGYLANIPISMLIIGLMIVISDYTIYGPASQYVANNVFNSDGTINTHCANDSNLSTAPFVCLAYYFSNNIQWVGITASSAIIPVPNVPKEFYGIIFKSLLTGVGVAAAMMFVVDILDGVLLSVGGGADTKLNASMFNSSSGLASQAFARIGATAKLAVDVPSDIASKAKTTIKDVGRASVDGYNKQKRGQGHNKQTKEKGYNKQTKGK